MSCASALTLYVNASLINQKEEFYELTNQSIFQNVRHEVDSTELSTQQKLLTLERVDWPTIVSRGSTLLDDSTAVKGKKKPKHKSVR